MKNYLKTENSKKKFPRLLSLDVFRGLTIMLMIVVNSPGNRTSFAILEHAVWNGCTLADLVFPFFILILGVSSVLTLAKKCSQGFPLPFLLGKTLKRTLFLFSLGLLLNAISLHFAWSTFRFLGVLQRIAICYFFTSLLYLTTRIRTQTIIAASLLIGYWLMMTLVPVPGYGPAQLTMDGNFATYVDRFFIPAAHLYMHSFDPEGLLSTLPAIATALFGNLLGAWLLSDSTPSQKLTGMGIVGICLLFIGWLWGYTFPINKSLWTSSYVLWTGGIAVLAFACCYWLIDIKGYQKWSKPFEILGVSALSAYVLHVLFLKIQAMIFIPVSDHLQLNLRMFITQTLFPFHSLEIASISYALSYTLLWLLILTMTNYKSKFITKLPWALTPFSGTKPQDL